MDKGVYVVGHYEGEKISEPKPTKSGGVFQERLIGVKVADLQIEMVEVPLDLKIIPDKEGNVVLPVKYKAQYWKEGIPRPQYAAVKFYIPKA